MKEELNNLLGKDINIFNKYLKIIRKKNNSKIEDSFIEWPSSWKTIYYKAYPRFKEMLLPRPNLPDIGLSKCLLNRESRRNFKKKAISLEKVSNLLFYSVGIKKSKSLSHSRFYPSAGARYPLEIYIFNTKNTSLKKAIYHYYVKDHSLEQLFDLSLFSSKDAFTVGNQKWANNALMFVVITAVIKRTVIKYGEVGYKYALLEAGHAAQNISLLASALNISCCGIGGYYDEYFEGLLDINPDSEHITYILALG